MEFSPSEIVTKGVGWGMSWEGIGILIWRMVLERVELLLVEGEVVEMEIELMVS